VSRAGDWDAAADAWARADARGKQTPPFDPAALLAPTGGAVSAELTSVAQRSAFASPGLLGAVTVLVAIIGVFLAYNANTGLPFVPTRELKVDLVNGAALVDGNDVYSGGYRIGLVSDMRPVRLGGGQVGAQLTLALNKSYGGVPVDSTVQLRP